MIYLIFTKIGFTHAENSVFENKATLWINDNILSDSQYLALSESGIPVNTLPIAVNPSNEKEVMAAIESIEVDNPDTEILVEYL